MHEDGRVSAVKLCECGCGEPAPIAVATKRSKGHVKGQPMRFVMGHNSRGIPKTTETRAKMAAYAKNRSAEHRTRLLEKRRLRPLNDTSNLYTIHSWLLSHFPKTHVCETCGKEGKTDFSFRWHPKPYTRNRNDYRELCRSCHTRYDVEIGIRPSWRERLSS